MRFVFSKYQGTGNDFIMADNRDGRWKLSNDQIMRLCDRHFGIGSDGLILIGASDEADFFMDFYNPDGSQSFCGNGSRCAVDFFRKIHGVGERFTFRAIDGVHDALWSPEEIRIKMKDVSDIELCGEGARIHTGSPHLLRYVPVPDDVDVFTKEEQYATAIPGKKRGSMSTSSDWPATIILSCAPTNAEWKMKPFPVVQASLLRHCPIIISMAEQVMCVSIPAAGS
jgi:diaminopimelate epimerase